MRKTRDCCFNHSHFYRYFITNDYLPWQTKHCELVKDIFSYKRVRPWFNFLLKYAANPGLFCNDDLLKIIMAHIEVDTDQADDDDMFKDLFEN